MKIFISGTNTDVGKTFITNKISKALIKKDLIVSISKPIETGVDNTPKDTFIHMQNQSIKYEIDDICFYKFKLPSAPFVADESNVIDLELIKDKIIKLEEKCDILLIEGAGGLFVPIKEDYFMLDLIKDLDAFCLLVCDSKLGCTNNLLSARKILEINKIDFISIINIFEKEEFLEISYPYIKLLDKNFIYQLEEERLIKYLYSKVLN